jgi:acetyl esterase/lipase
MMGRFAPLRLMLTVGGLLALLFIIATPSHAVMDWPDLLSRPHPQPSKRIAYGGDPLQYADLWLPKGPGPFPTVLMIHGGCWLSDVAKADIMDYAAGALRDRGIAVWNIDYRGVDRPGGGYPGTFADVAAAADALAANAPRYHLSLDRLTAFGHSAGGHLALWAAARANLPRTSSLWRPNPLRIATVISTGGLPDLEANRELSGCGGPALMDALTGLSHRDPAGAYRDTSPAHMLPIPARLILVAGALDPISPPRLTQDFAHKAGAAKLLIIPGEGHVELISPGSGAWQAELGLIELALARQPH